MTDTEIIEVVTAHKEGKKIQHRFKDDDFYQEDGWGESTSGMQMAWNFSRFDYRVAPEPRKLREYWIDSNASNGPWSCWNYVPSYPSGSLEQQCLVHVREVDDGSSSVKRDLDWSTVETSTKETHPRKPREWTVYVDNSGILHSSPPFGISYFTVKVREVLE